MAGGTVNKFAVQGIGYNLVLTTLGGMRELVGQGTLFHQAHLLPGEAARGLTLSLGSDFRGR